MKLAMFISQLYRKFVENGLKFFLKLSKNDSQKEKVIEEFATLGYLTASIEHELRTPLEVFIKELRILEKLIADNYNVKPSIDGIEQMVSRIRVAININKQPAR